jgi:hypothetical protein
MDETSKRTLDGILAKKPEVLSETEKAVLRARRSYLTESQKRDFADVLDEEEEAPKEPKAPKAPKEPKK